MIFRQAQQVLDGTKTQTRRPVKPGDKGLCLTVYRPDEITWVGDSNGRTRWAVLADYAVQPGRGKKSLGRIRITKIRRERLLEIKPTDCIKEGIVAHLVLFDHEYYREGSKFAFSTPRSAFRHLWDSLYRKPYRWEDNPEVWVLEFELVEQERSKDWPASE